MTDFRETVCSVCFAEVQPDNMTKHLDWHRGLGAEAAAAARQDSDERRRGEALGGADFS